MDAEGETRVVPEDELDRVAHFCTDERPEHAQVLPSRRAGLQLRERRVGVLTEQGLQVDLADPLGPFLDEDVLLGAEGLAGDLIPLGA
jgi:hypothetical protein